MPFGLKNVGQTFQRFMDDILAGIPHVFIYLVDVLVASPTVAEHKKDLQRVMEALEKHGLVINGEKCQFHKSQVEFLGHLVDKSGIKQLTANVEAITCSQLLSFLGMINFFFFFKLFIQFLFYMYITLYYLLQFSTVCVAITLL